MAGSSISKLFASGARHVLVESHASGEVAGSRDETVFGVVIGITVISIGVGNDCLLVSYRVRSLMYEIHDNYLPMLEQ
jgi:hypothetical protein